MLNLLNSIYLNLRKPIILANFPVVTANICTWAIATSMLNLAYSNKILYFATVILDTAASMLLLILSIYYCHYSRHIQTMHNALYDSSNNEILDLGHHIIPMVHAATVAPRELDDHERLVRAELETRLDV